MLVGCKESSIAKSLVCVDTIHGSCGSQRASLVAQMLKNLPAVWGLGLIPGLGRSLEKGIGTHSSILAWRIPRTEEPGKLQSQELQRIGHN